MHPLTFTPPPFFVLQLVPQQTCCGLGLCQAKPPTRPPFLCGHQKAQHCHLCLHCCRWVCDVSHPEFNHGQGGARLSHQSSSGSSVGREDEIGCSAVFWRCISFVWVTEGGTYLQLCRVACLFLRQMRNLGYPSAWIHAFASPGTHFLMCLGLGFCNRDGM